MSMDTILIHQINMALLNTQMTCDLPVPHHSYYIDDGDSCTEPVRSPTMNLQKTRQTAHELVNVSHETNR